MAIEIAPTMPARSIRSRVTGPGFAVCTVTVTCTVYWLPEVSVARARIVFAPDRRVTLPDHDVVPLAKVHVVPSVLSSTFSTATLSDATPVTVTVAEVSTLLSAGEPIAIVGRVESVAIGVAEASFDFGPSPTPFTALTS